MRFRAVAAEWFSWVQWGDDCVLYHHPSGKTHFLNAGAALLLQQVLIDPQDPSAAAEALARLQGAIVDARFQDYVAKLLQRLDELGLVGRVPA